MVYLLNLLFMLDCVGLSPLCVCACVHMSTYMCSLSQKIWQKCACAHVRVIVTKKSGKKCAMCLFKCAASKELLHSPSSLWIYSKQDINVTKGTNRHPFFSFSQSLPLPPSLSLACSLFLPFVIP